MTYLGNPNSTHQLWSMWVFTIRVAGKDAPRADVEYNVAKWLRMGFGSAGRVRVSRTIYGWKIQVMIEGKPAHDPDYVASVKKHFEDFVAKGFGVLATGEVQVKVLAGDKQDGKPAEQMIEVRNV